MSHDNKFWNLPVYLLLSFTFGCVHANRLDVPAVTLFALIFIECIVHFFAVLCYPPSLFRPCTVPTKMFSNVHRWLATALCC